MISFYNPLMNIENNKSIRFVGMGKFISRFMNFGQTAYVVAPSDSKDQKTIRVYQNLFKDADELSIVTISLKEKVIKILLIGSTFVLSYALSPLFLLIPAAIVIANGIFLLSNSRFVNRCGIDADLKAWVQDSNFQDDKETAARRIQKAFVEESKELKIGCLGLTNLPPCIGKLKNLETLELYCNLFTELPKEIGELINLKKLELSYNSLLTTFQKQICQLEQLEELDLSGNKMETIPAEIKDLKELKELFLSGNKFKKFPKELCELKNLRSLKLSYNEIEELPEEISELKNLYTLALYDNKLQSLPETINDCTKLEYLELSRNKFTSFPKHIGKHPTLLKVQLSANDPTLEEPKNFLKRDGLEIHIIP